MDKACALQIVKENDHKFTLDLESLQGILSQPEVRDRKVVVISVAGAFRKGKSFLLGFFLRYLYAKYEQKDATDWLVKGGDVVKGFSWRSGPERHTTGIWMWNHIFLHENDHDKIAIILLDTQGVFDNKSTAQDCAFIFALSTLLSSVQVYNLSMNIQENDLHHLQLFTEYGRLVMDESSSTPFQKLLILIRDWGHDYLNSYGLSGGKEVLDKYLQTEPTQHVELRTVREHIKSCFSAIDCFLMPHPGLDVTKPKFHGQLNFLETDFKDEIEVLVPSLVAPEVLETKTLNGQHIVAKDFIHLFNTYMNAFAKDDIPRPETILSAQAEFHHIVAVTQTKDHYINEMKKLCEGDNFLPESEFKAGHLDIQERCIQMFNSKKKMGGSVVSDRFREELKNVIESLFDIYNNTNNAKIAIHRAKVREWYLNAREDSIDHYEREMNKLFVSNKYMSNEDFEENHRKRSETALEKFEACKMQNGDDNLYEKYFTELRDCIIFYYEKYKIQNADNKLIASNANEGVTVKKFCEAREIYYVNMHAFIEGKQYIEEADLRKNHDANKAYAMMKYIESKSFGKDYFEKYEKLLESEIKRIFETFVKRNNDKRSLYNAAIQRKNNNARFLAMDFYYYEMDTFFLSKGDYVSVEDFNNKHEELKKDAITKFASESTEKGESYAKNLSRLEKEIENIYKLFKKIRKESSMCTIS